MTTPALTSERMMTNLEETRTTRYGPTEKRFSEISGDGQTGVEWPGEDFVHNPKRIQYVSADDLEKAEPRGGKYHRRVTTKKGGYRYYYDADKYGRSKDAHVDGEGAAKARIRATVEKAIKAEGKCPVEGLKALVKRYGADMVSSVCKAGGYQFKKGMLYPGKKSDENLPEKE